MEKLFSGIYKNRSVLVTGHTGFKGSWLVLWLRRLGARVYGYSLEPPTDPNHHALINQSVPGVCGDVRDLQKLSDMVRDTKPEIVFHLAAQPIVRRSYRDPIDTFSTNVMGTLNVFEACRSTGSAKAIVNVTSDKCYENREWIWGYRENDPMGGFDPYSASKGCAELITASYRNSFFHLDSFTKTHNTLLSSVRAGNVVGGGDWAEDRLIPDIVRAASIGKDVLIRSPHATRPWQHVLDPLSGYLQLGWKLLEGEKTFASAWNFGPGDEGSMAVIDVLKIIKAHWDKISFVCGDVTGVHEANLLKLDCSKAHGLLGWKSVWDFNTAIEKATSWYKAYYENNSVISDPQLDEYIEDAVSKGIRWL
jgi:CDP-glucose 4,6-dehydratase